MRDYGKVSPQFWTDINGDSVVVLKGRLTFTKPGPARLRAYLMQRDKGVCVICGKDDDLVVDHVVSIKNGGSNHPDNLRMLCSECNSRKVGLFDARKTHERKHITNGKWVVSEDVGGDIRVGVLLPGRSVSFCLDEKTARQIARAILDLRRAK